MGIEAVRRAIKRASHNTDLSDRTVVRLAEAYRRAAEGCQPYVDIRLIDRRGIDPRDQQL